MKKIYSAILLSFFIFHFSFLIAIAQTDPLVESGKIKQKAGNHSGAIYDFTSAIKQNELEVTNYLKKFEGVHSTSTEGGESARNDSSILMVALGFSVDANFAIPYYLRGFSYSYSGKNNEAMNDFNTAIKINPKMGSAYYERGKLLWSTGKKDAGCMDLGRAGSLNDSSAREMFDEKFCWKEAVVAYKESSSKVRFNDFQGALDEIQKAIQLCPDSANYLGIRGRAYLGLGNYEFAMKDFDKAISLSKKSIHAYFGRGVAYYLKDEWQEAFNDLSKAIQLNDRFADAYLYRAYTCEGMEKNQSALFDYQQVQRLKPGDALAFFRSGLLKDSMDDIKGACNDFNRAASMGHSEAQDYAEKCNTTKK
ncbi:MAG: tetratricopeptide repeat protein [Bacteroidota bacterium]